MYRYAILEIAISTNPVTQNTGRTTMWKYLFSGFDPRFGQQPDESHMDESELDDYDAAADAIERGHWEQVLVDEANAANEAISCPHDSFFDSNDSNFGN